MKRVLVVAAAAGLLAVLLVVLRALRPGPEPAALSIQQQEKPVRPPVGDASETKANGPSQRTDNTANSRGRGTAQTHSGSLVGERPRHALDVSEAATARELREREQEEAQRQPLVAARTGEELHAALKASNPDYDRHATKVTEHEGVAYGVIVRGRCVRDLGPLAGFRGLRRVALDGYDTTPDLSPLRELGGLSYLCLANFAELSDLSPIAGLDALRRLQLADCPNVSDLGPLSRLTKLEELRISSCPKLTDLEPVAKLTSLRKLSLCYCTGISDLRPLGRLATLEVLEFFQRKPPRDVSALVLLARSGCRIETSKALQAMIERLARPAEF